jgi:PAS domain S-box-containing protein
MPMVVSDPRQPDTPIVLANEAFLKLTGYSADEVIGHNCRFLQGPATAPEAVDEIRRGMAADDHFVTAELLNYRKDGSTFWNQLEISPVHNEAGETIYYFASQRDVTSRRRAQELEATERLLLMEVDHRSMNALGLVQSILQLTRADDIAGYSAAVRRRIDSISRVHRILARSSWGATLVTELIAEEAPDERYGLEGPPVKISARLAQPIAVVLHELMANARQHGALRCNDGALTLSWDVSPGELHLEWREKGIKPVEVGPAPGIGLSLVKAVVERQLEGTTNLRFAGNEFQATLVIPTQENDVVSST